MAFSFPDTPTWWLVAEVFQDAAVPFPPYGLELVAQDLPPLLEPARERPHDAATVPDQVPVDLLGPSAFPTVMPPRRVTRPLDSLVETAVARASVVHDGAGTHSARGTDDDLLGDDGQHTRGIAPHHRTHPTTPCRRDRRSGRPPLAPDVLIALRILSRSPALSVVQDSHTPNAFATLSTSLQACVS